ncbi:MAG: hypothetical protein AAFV33_08200 [Chloroflexota bacterium]
MDGMELTYQQRDDEIHHFQFLRATRTAVDAFLMQLDDVMERYVPGAPMLILVDTGEAGVLPFGYTFNGVRDAIKKHGSREYHNFRIALVHSPSATMAPMWMSILSVVPTPVDVKAFPATARETAIVWLLES